MEISNTDRNLSNRLAFLDGLRGLAAVYVMLGHARWLLWEGFAGGYLNHPNQYTPFSKVLAYLSLGFDYGHQAVIFFFVLSGFVIHLRYAQDFKRNGVNVSFDSISFFFRRFRRIYPLFLLAMALTFGLDFIGQAQGYAIYSQQTAFPLINSITVDHSWLAGIGNGLLWPNSPSWGTNNPLWSLRIEWWFYVIYPLLWLISRRSIRFAAALVGTLFILSFATSLWPVEAVRLVFAALPAWFLGALLADGYVGRFSVRFSRIGGLLLLFPILPLLLSPFNLLHLPDSLIDFLWSLGFVGVIAACLAWRNRGGSLRLLDSLKPLGNISYSLYVLHFPILALLAGWLISRDPDGWLPADFSWVAIGAVLCIVVAYVVYRVFERPILRWEPAFVAKSRRHHIRL